MKCLQVLFVIAVFFASGEALLKCYECTATSGCDDPFDKSGAGVRETLFAPGCVCAKEVIEFASGDHKLTTRTCVKPDYVYRSGDARANMPFKSYTLNLCDSDLCNGASSIIATQITFFALIVLLIFTHWQ